MNSETDTPEHWMLLQELEVAHEELREAEAHLHQQADELAHTVEEFELERRTSHDLFDCAPEPYVVTDPSGSVVQANRCAAELLGVERVFLPRKPLLLFVDPADRDRYLQLLAAASQSDGRTLRSELRLRPRGGQRSVSCLVSMSRSSGGASGPGYLRWVACQRPDVTEPDVGMMRSEFPEHPLPSPDFTRQVAQELRTSLSSVAGRLQIVRKQLEPHTPEYGALASVTRSVRVMIRLAEHLMESGPFEQSAPDRHRSLSLLEFVGDLVHELRVEALHRGIRLMAQLESRVPAIVADRDQLQSALRRLLEGTTRSTSPGGQLFVALSKSSNGPVLTIRSSGCGVDRELLEGVTTASAGDDPDLRRCLQLHGATLESDTSSQDGAVTLTILFTRVDSSHSRPK